MDLEEHLLFNVTDTCIYYQMEITVLSTSARCSSLIKCFFFVFSCVYQRKDLGGVHPLMNNILLSKHHSLSFNACRRSEARSGLCVG